MARFSITETRIVKVTAVIEAKDEESAEELWSDGCEPLSISEEVEDSYGLEVEPGDALAMENDHAHP